jgi:hypothetical protein
MTKEALQFVGQWEKITTSPCSQIYPDRIAFQENGLYFAQNNPHSPMIIWDTGRYTVVSAQQVRITLANDASDLYAFSISNGILTLVDSRNCEFQYRKSG